MAELGLPLRKLLPHFPHDESIMKTRSPSTNLVWSTLAAQSSEQIALAAGPLVVVFVLGGGVAETGILQMVQTLPFLLLALPIGVLVDRASRKNLMIMSELVRAATAFAIIIALALNVLSVPLLAILGFVGAIGTLTFSIASPALLPSLVAPGELSPMNRRLELARSAAFVAGPPLGGALVGWTGAPLAFAAAMAASIVAILLLSPLHEPQRVSPTKRRIWPELVEGCQFVMHHHLLLPIAATAMLFNIGWFVLQAVFVVFLIDHLGSNPGMVGLLFGFYGVGMIVGALAAAPLSRIFSLGTLIAIGPLGGCLGSVLVLLTVVAPSLLLIGAAMFCFGFGPILWSINTTSLRQVVTPSAMLGRVSALLTLATSGARPLGAGLGVVIASVAGMEACLAASALCFCLQLFIILSSAPARLRFMPEAASPASALVSR